MRRAPIVIGGTVAGLVGVLAFHTKAAPLSLPTTAGAAAAAGSAASAGPGGTTQGQSQPASGTSPSSGSAGQQASGARTAVGPAVNYNYGVLSVKVTVSGHKILKVGIASIDDGGNPRSQYIDQQSIPMLEQQAIQAQSGNIQGVSGASYTSSGFAQSLQSALHGLSSK
jgi:uncharacterized protein with FMN-binding domain